MQYSRIYYVEMRDYSLHWPWRIVFNGRIPRSCKLVNQASLG